MEYQGKIMNADEKAQSDIVVRCSGVSKSFPRKKEADLLVVKDFNLEVKKNDFVVLFGPGQCGKTTLINMIAGLEPVSSGSVYVNGQEVKEPGPDRGVVYQETCLFPWLTVMGNVEFGLKAQGVDKLERQKEAQYYIDLMGLNGFEKHYPNKLSGGMQQRVGIARAYCIKPAVMLLDEPFGHLDAQTRYLMEEELEKIWTREKRTVLFVTNNIEEAIYLADRIVLLSNIPTVVREEFVIDLPRPRSLTDPDFLILRKEICKYIDTTL